MLEIPSEKPDDTKKPQIRQKYKSRIKTALELF